MTRWFELLRQKGFCQHHHKGEKLALVFKTCELDDAGAFSTLLVFVLLSRVLVLDLDLDVARHLELRDHGVCEEWGARPDQLLA